MFERFPILTFVLLGVGVFVFGIVFMWLWSVVGLIWAMVIAGGLLLLVAWLLTDRPTFLRRR